MVVVVGGAAPERTGVGGGENKCPLDVDESGFFTFPPGASDGQPMFEVARVAGDRQEEFHVRSFFFSFFDFSFFLFFFFALVQFAALAKAEGDKRQLKPGHRDMEAPTKTGNVGAHERRRWRRESAAMQIHFSIHFFIAE